MRDDLDSGFWASLGINYPDSALALARSRGWDDRAHEDAIVATDEDAIALTHPYNWLSEQEAEDAASVMLL